jgi:hypothetical protein
MSVDVPTGVKLMPRGFIISAYSYRNQFQFSILEFLNINIMTAPEQLLNNPGLLEA